MKKQEEHIRSKRQLIFKPGHSIPRACEKVNSFKELTKCYNQKKENNIDLSCKVAEKSCYYRVECKQVGGSFKCTGVHDRTSILCCDYKCLP